MTDLLGAPLPVVFGRVRVPDRKRDNHVGAELYWGRVWGSGQWSNQWADPDPWVVQRAVELIDSGSVHVLDLGCGIGRHALALAFQGAVVTGVDASGEALDRARQFAAAAALPATFLQCTFDQLPFASDSFEYVLAYNAIYHGDERAVRRALDEIRRVLKPAGLYQSTMLSKQNRNFGRGIQISHNTFVQPDALDDKSYAHYYVDDDELRAMHRGFELLELSHEEHETPGSFHYHCIFRGC